MPLSPGVSALELIKVMSLWYTKDLSLEMPRRKSEAIQAADASATADMEAGAAVGAAGSGQGALQKKSSARSQSASGSKPSESPRAVPAEASCGTSVCSIS